MQTSVQESGLGLEQGPALLRLASRLAGTRDAEDLVQATWVRALEHPGAVRARGSWLRQVLVNERRMQLRASKRRDQREMAVATGDDHDDHEDMEDVVHCLEVARIIGDLLHELDDDVEAVVRQRYFEGKTAADIARSHGIPAGTVRWRLKMGLDHLRDMLDARYGGRRAVWAGAFLPFGIAPTLATGVASGCATAGTTTSTAAKGTSAMMIKILLGAAITAATAGGVVYATSNDDVRDAPGPDVSRAPAAEPASPSPAAVADARPGPAKPAAPSIAAETIAKKAAWRDRLSKIHAAHGIAHEPSSAHASAGDEDCDRDHPEAAMCMDEGCVQRLATEVMGLTEGCRELMADAPPDLTLTARVVGAPDVGTLVESVELGGDADAPPELAECLTESMYTLDLGEAEANFEQEITVMLRSESVVAGEPLDLDHLDDETREKVEAAIAEMGDGEHGQVRILRLGTEIPVPEDEAAAPAAE